MEPRYDQDSSPAADQGAAAALTTFLGALGEDRRCKHTIQLLSGGLAAFAARYPFLLKGENCFSDAEFPSEVGVVPPDLIIFVVLSTCHLQPFSLLTNWSYVICL